MALHMLLPACLGQYISRRLPCMDSLWAGKEGPRAISGVCGAGSGSPATPVALPLPPPVLPLAQRQSGKQPCPFQELCHKLFHRPPLTCMAQNHKPYVLSFYFFFSPKEALPTCFLSKEIQSLTTDPAVSCVLLYSVYSTPPPQECCFYWALPCRVLAQTLLIRLCDN